MANLFAAGRFRVPRHQRYYDWEKRHVETLLQDLADAVDENSPCHFLGSIMLINSTNAGDWEINDGQQRAVTFSLICAYLCKFFSEEGRVDGEKKTLRILYDIGEFHSHTLQDAPKLNPRITPPRSNKIHFTNLIHGHDVGRNGKMVEAWKKIVSFFEEAGHQRPAWREKLLDFMLNNVIVIRLEVDKSLDSNAIFETLNYRGKHVEQMDLIKNHFLQSFNNDPNLARIDAICDRFEAIYGSFGNKVESVAEYIRCYMQVEMGFIRKEQFWKGTKMHFRDRGTKKSDEIYSLVGRLADGGRIQTFKTFLRKSSNEDVLDKLTSDAGKANLRRKIRDYLLDVEGYTITRPIIFALLLLYVDTKDARKKTVAKTVYACAKLLASFTQRVAHVGDFKPSLYEEKFANLAMQISTKTCTTADAFFAALQTFDNVGIINDKHYIEKLTTNFSLRSDKKFAYIVKRIAEYWQPGLKISDNGNQITIEHILPLSTRHNSKPAWSSFSLEERARFSRALGNLTVLARGEDSSTDRDNESFSAKKKIYAKTSYKLTNDLCQHSAWTPIVVKQRQHDMAKTAAKQIWNFQF